MAEVVVSNRSPASSALRASVRACSGVSIVTSGKLQLSTGASSSPPLMLTLPCVAGVCAAFADLPACRAPSQPSKGSAATIAMVGRRARKPCSGNVGGMQTRTVAR